MEKITTTLREYFIDNDIYKQERPVENIVFIGKHNDVFGKQFTLFDRHFRNCEFELYSAYGYNISFVDCVFENCVFYAKSIFADFINCLFLNNSFPNGFRYAFNPSTRFRNCIYDNSILELLHKEIVCPLSGEFIGWKKGYLCRCMSVGSNCVCLLSREIIIKLLVPKDSKRSSSISNKCRCEKAKVLEIQDIDGKKIDILEGYIAVSIYEFKSRDRRLLNYASMDELRTRYIPGEMVYPNKFNPDPLVECGEGIHFFMTREEALNYDF